MGSKPSVCTCETEDSSYGELFLQAVVEVFDLVGLQFFQRDSCFPDELIVAEFVLITHWDPEKQNKQNKKDKDNMKKEWFHC